jgi:hypothetical protein
MTGILNSENTITLVQTLGGIRLRLGLHQWARFCAVAFLYALSLASFWLFLTRLFPVLGDALPVLLGLLCAGLILATILGWSRRPDIEQAALLTDRRLKLEERLTTSLALASSTAPMVDAVHADAKHHLSGVNGATLFPFEATKAMRWAMLPLLIFSVGYVFLPTFDLFNYEKKQEEERARVEAIRVTAERLVASVKPLVRAEEAQSGEVDDIKAEIERVANDLKEARITEKQAFARVTNLARELQENREALARENPLPKVMKSDLAQFDMARDVADAMQQGKFGEAARKMEALEKKLGEGALDAKEMEQLKKELASLAKSLEGQNSALSQALAAALQAAGKSMNSQDIKGALEAMKLAKLSLNDMDSLKRRACRVARRWR